MVKYVAGSFIALALSLTVAVGSAQADPYEKLGYGRLMTNDFLGDGEDRWRTGSWTSSRAWVP